MTIKFAATKQFFCIFYVIVLYNSILNIIGFVFGIDLEKTKKLNILTFLGINSFVFPLVFPRISPNDYYVYL